MSGNFVSCRFLVAAGIDIFETGTDYSRPLVVDSPTVREESRNISLSIGEEIVFPRVGNILIVDDGSIVKIRFGIGAGAFESGRQAVLGIEIVFVFDFAGIAVQSIGSRLFESRPQNLFLRTVQEIAVENGIVPVVPQIVQVDGQPIRLTAYLDTGASVLLSE